MRFILLLAATVPLLLAATSAAAARAFLCTDAIGQNPFHLDFTEQGLQGNYDIASEPGTSPTMFGGGTLSRLDGGTGFEIVDGPLEEALKASFLHPASGTTLVIDGPQSGVHYCEKSKAPS